MHLCNTGLDVCSDEEKRLIYDRVEADLAVNSDHAPISAEQQEEAKRLGQFSCVMTQGSFIAARSLTTSTTNTRT